MRKMPTLVLGFALLLPTLVGCTLFRNLNPRPDDGPKLPIQPDRKPDTVSLVNYLNKNAQRLQAIQARVEIDAKQGNQPIALSGSLAAEQPRNFRMRGQLLGRPAVDIGSNDDRFWYWISQAKPPYYYFCTYKDLSTGKVPIPFPVEVDMVMAALNMSEYDPKGKYDLKATESTLELTQDITSASGQAVKRTTVFNAKLAKGAEPQVIEHQLRDEKGKLICRAKVQKVEADRTSGGIVPTRVVIEWPAQSVSMKLMLSDVRVNKIDKGGSARMFTLDGNGQELYDLARGSLVKPTSTERATIGTPRR